MGSQVLRFDKSVWEKKFMSEQAWRLHDSVAKKQVLLQLLERPLNLEMENDTYANIVTEIEEKGWLPLTKDLKGKANLTLLRGLYANWDLNHDDIVRLHGRDVDISIETIRKYYKAINQGMIDYWRK